MPEGWRPHKCDAVHASGGPRPALLALGITKRTWNAHLEMALAKASFATRPRLQRDGDT